MYPQRELTLLAAHKAGLQRSITRRRLECAEAAAEVARPLEWLDRALAFWRRLSPLAKLAALPLGWMVKRTVLPRVKFLGPLMRWGPLLFGAARGLGAAFKSRSPSTSPSSDEG